MSPRSGLGYLTCWLAGICCWKTRVEPAGTSRACATARVPSPALHSFQKLPFCGRAGPTDLGAPLLVVRHGFQPNLFSFPSLLGGVRLVVRTVSDGPTPELSLTGADDSAERTEQAGWGREQQLRRGAGRGGQGCREWGREGRVSLALRTRSWTRRPRTGTGWGAHNPLSSPAPDHPDLSQGGQFSLQSHVSSPLWAF